MTKARVEATDPVARAGAEAIIDDGGSATDAIVAGILSAGAARAGVLLGPVVGLVGGVGAGTRLFDGRTLQPGLGNKRPRGLTDDQSVPLAARCAVPRSFATLALMQAYAAKRPLSALVRCAKTTAKRRETADDGLEARLTVLDGFPQHGAATLAPHDRALVRAAGTTAGGILSARDLDQARPDDSRPSYRALPEGEIASPDWPEAPCDEATRGAILRQTHVIVAADGRGLVAAASYLNSTDGLLVPELGLRLAPTAAPVRRGVPRVTPGTPLWSAAPIALLRRTAEGWHAAAGAAGAEAVADDDLASLTATLDQQVQALRSASGCEKAIIAAVQRGRTSAASAPASM